MNSPLNALAKPDALTPCLALRAREAAAALGISERTLWTLTHAGDVPHLRVGSAVLYPVRELADWLTKQAKAVAGAPDSAPQAAENSGNIAKSSESSILRGTIGGGQ